MRNFCIFPILAALALTGCASAVPDALTAAPEADESPLSGLTDLAERDLTAALNDASAHDDVIAAQCYAFLLGKLPDVGTGIQAPVGVVSAFQKARNIRRKVCHFRSRRST